MPPRGVKKGSKRARQYEHVKKSEKRAGRSNRTAERIASATVNKERARSGESRRASRSSKTDISSSRRGGLRSGKGPGGRTRDQLYAEAEAPGRGRALEDEQEPAGSRRRPLSEGLGRGAWFAEAAVPAGSHSRTLWRAGFPRLAVCPVC